MAMTCILKLHSTNIYCSSVKFGGILVKCDGGGVG